MKSEALAPQIDEAGLVFRDGAFADDTWTWLADDEPLPESGAVVLSLGRFAGTPDLPGRDLAIVVRAGENVATIADRLPRLAMIAIDFPKFSDGRGFSTARLLRERFEYAGELRAIGDVLMDQIPLMRRCGIDSFAVTHQPTRAALAAGRLPEVPLYLQPVRSKSEVPAGTRPWARKPGPAALYLER